MWLPLLAASLSACKTLLDSKRFPDDFYEGGSAGIVFDFTSSKSLDIECIPMLDQAVVEVRNAVTGDVASQRPIRSSSSTSGRESTFDGPPPICCAR